MGSKVVERISNELYKLCSIDYNNDKIFYDVHEI